MVSKYRNKRTRVDGHTLDSKAEAQRYRDLRLMEHAGQVRHLRVHPSYKIDVNGVHVCRYVADFAYDLLQADGWTPVVEDVKGHKTAVYKLKRKLMRAVHGIDIWETQAW